MSELALREPTPLAVEEKPPFQQIRILTVENVTKGRYIGAMVVHNEEAMAGLATLARDNRVKTIILEDSPSLMDVIEGKKTIKSHMNEIFNVDLDANPDLLNIPRLASYKRRCEILLELKERDPELKIIIVDPYYDKQAVGPKGETYEERMILQKSIRENSGRMELALANKDFYGARENAKVVAKETAREIVISDEMRASAIAKGEYRGNVLIESGEGHVRLFRHLEANVKDSNISVMFANREVIEKVFKEDKNFYPPLLQLAHQYIEKGEALEKDVADLLAARACVAAEMFNQELKKLLMEGKRMTAEKDYEIIKGANALKTVDDCIREINALQKR